MPDESDITVGELSRRLTAQERMFREALSVHDKNIRDQFKEVKELINSKDYVPMSLYLSERKAQDEKIGEVIENARYFRRTVIQGAMAFVVAVGAPLVLLFLNLRGR